MPFAVAWMDPKIAMLSEVSQTEKDKCHLISLLSDGILKKWYLQMKVFTKLKWSPGCRKLIMVTKGGKGYEG